MESSTEPLSAIDVGAIREEYDRRGLASWTDRQLVGAVARVVARPRRDRANSFVLHAPLELTARTALLPWVRPGERELARLHIVAIAAMYDAFGPPAEDAVSPSVAVAEGLVGPPAEDVAGDTGVVGGGIDSAVDALAEAVVDGDVEQADRAAAAIAAMANEAPGRLASWLGDLVLPLTSAAAHAPIFLYQFARVSRRGELSAELLRPLARELAREPGWRLSWVDDWTPAGPTDHDTLTTALEQTPILGRPGSDFIHPLLMQVDQGDVAADHLGPAIGHYSDAAARAVLRVAARSMLSDTRDHAPYGWTHCLTMPQAVLGIADQITDPHRALAIAVTQVMAFRAGLGEAELPPFDLSALPAVEPTELATVAATSHDAHIVKYVLACLDAAACDPAASTLYLAAGHRLLDVWAERGDPTDPLA